MYFQQEIWIWMQCLRRVQRIQQKQWWLKFLCPNPVISDVKWEIWKPISNQYQRRAMITAFSHSHWRQRDKEISLLEIFFVHPNAMRKGFSSYCGLYTNTSHVQQHEENSIFVHIKEHLVLYDTLWIKPKVTGKSFLKFIINTVKYCHGFII